MEGLDNPVLQMEDEVPPVKQRKMRASQSADSGLELEDKSLRQSHSQVHLTAAEDATSDDEESLPGDQSCAFVGDALQNFWAKIGRLASSYSSQVRGSIYIALAILYNVYFVAAVYYAMDNDIELDWCDGVGFLIILTAIVYVALFYFQVVKRFWGRAIHANVLKPAGKLYEKLWAIRWCRYLFYLLIVAALVTFLVIDTWDEPNRLVSFGGLLIFLCVGFVFSKHPGKVLWSQVAWGLALQFIFGLIVLRWEVGRSILRCVADKVTTFLDYTAAGSGFVYGYLVTGVADNNVAIGTIFAFKILSVIFFFSLFVNILYYYGAMQWVVTKIGWLLQISIGTTAAESMNAAANIFLGQTEAPLLVKPYLPLMTKSELHAVMTGGFATIAGAVLAAYVNFGINAANLLTASVMAAPAALAFSKLFYPESEKSKTKAGDIKIEKGSEANALDAAAQGASNAVFLVMNIIANLIAFLAFIEFLNAVVSWFGGLLGADYITFQWLLGKIFIPVAWCMGVPPDECETVGNLVALKSIVNEFAAYSKLSEYIRDGALSKRSETIATFALCGFANPGSIGTQIAALSTMAPQRKSDLAEVAFRAFISGTVACFMTACIAGTLTSSIGVGTTTVPPTTTTLGNLTFAL